MSIEKILIVDDDLLMRNLLAETLRLKNFQVFTAESGHQAIHMLKETAFEMVITDMKMPDLTGIEVLRKVKELSPNTVVVIITAFGSIENAVHAMRCGAFNYLIKPFSPDTIEAVIEKAEEHLSLIQENQFLKQQLSPVGKDKNLTVICQSPLMKQILDEVNHAAKSNASIFIHGESGTGKEVIAQYIHIHSPRAEGPFIKVNCAAIPETLIESEFFGHEKGAFTGANARRIGRFELANHGTLLLDEITETPTALQAKLLRVTQEQQFERLGGSKPINVNVRLISTSNRDMQEAISQKMIREDLYYRLNVIPIYLPALRDRKEDILPLAHYFLEKAAMDNQQMSKIFTTEAQKKLLSYSWPGNIRELANVIERAVVLDASPQIATEHLFIEASKEQERTKETDKPKFSLPVGITLQDLEKQLIIETLEAHHNNRTKTAQTLGISTKTLRSKILDYKLEK